MTQDKGEKDCKHDFGMAVLISGEIEGHDFWAYVSVAPEKYEEFIAHHQAGEYYIISDYGDVIEHGFDATEPPPEIKEKMEKEYGFDHEYQKKIEAISHDLLAQLKPDNS